MVSGVADVDDELFTLNDTGKEIWKRLDGKKTLSSIVDELVTTYDASKQDIEKDVVGLVEELEKRGMVIAA